MKEKKLNLLLLAAFCITLILNVVAICFSVDTGGPGVIGSSGVESSTPQESSKPIESSEISIHNHNYTFANTVAPTCTAKGYDVYSCVGCQDSQTTNFTDPLGHEYNPSTHVCVRCSSFDPKHYTLGLIFDVNPDKTAWVVTGYEGGDNNVNIPSEYSNDGINYFPVESIATSAFINSTITSINISGIKKIDNNAFYNCKYLSEVILDESIEEIGNSAFFGCTALTTITIPKGVNKIGSYAFAYCTSLENVIYDAKNLSVDLVKESNVFAASGISGLKLTIGENVESIPSFLAFNSKIQTLVLSENIKKINKQAFDGCYQLQKINYNIIKLDTELTVESKVFCTGLDCNIIFGENVESIPNYAFYTCNNIKSITLNNKVKLIGDYSFAQCVSLQNFVIPASVTSIGEGAFTQCTSLTELNIPDSITTLGANAFKSCTNLSKLHIGLGVTEIPKECFAECVALTELHLGKNVTAIKSGAFKQIAIDYLDFEENELLQYIEGSAFSMCRNLKTLRFTSFISLYKDSFSQNSIETIYLENERMVQTANAYSDFGGALESIKVVYVLKSLTETENYKPGNHILQLLVVEDKTINEIVYVSYHNHEYKDGSCTICGAQNN